MGNSGNKGFSTHGSLFIQQSPGGWIYCRWHFLRGAGRVIICLRFRVIERLLLGSCMSFSSWFSFDAAKRASIPTDLTFSTRPFGFDSNRLGVFGFASNWRPECPVLCHVMVSFFFLDLGKVRVVFALWRWWMGGDGRVSHAYMIVSLDGRWGGREECVDIMDGCWRELC